MSDPMSRMSDTQMKVALAVIVSLIIGVAVWQAFFTSDDAAAPPPDKAETTAGEPFAAQRQSPNDAFNDAFDGSASTASPRSEQSDDLVESEDEASAEGDGGEEDNSETRAPGFTAPVEREVKVSDVADAETLLATVVPVWASHDTRGEDAAKKWGQVLGSTRGVAPSFFGQSRRGYFDLWSTAAGLGVRVEGAEIESADQLWNEGSHSLWRVTVNRDVVSNSGNSMVDGTESVTWDFFVDQTGESFEVQAYAPPLPANEESDTFSLPESVRRSQG